MAAAAAGADYLGAGAGEGFWGMELDVGAASVRVLNGHVTTTCVR